MVLNEQREQLTIFRERENKKVDVQNLLEDMFKLPIPLLKQLSALAQIN